MAINRYNKPVNSRLISQFVPQDLNMIAKVLAGKQQRYDIETGKMELLQDQLSNLTGVGAADLDIIRQSGLNLDKIAGEYSNKDLADPRIAKELRSKAKAIFNDPLIKNTQQSVLAMKQYKEDKRKIKDYRPENDYFADQVREYQQSGGAVNGPLSYTGIIEGVDEYEAASQYFDDIPESGKSSWVRIDDTIKKVGWEGIDKETITGQVWQSVNSFGSSQAGQQALRRYNKLAQAGRLTEDATPEKYLAGILANAGRERIGGKGTGASAGMSSDGMGGFASQQSTGVLTQFTPPEANAVAGAEYNEQGALIGDGNISYIDVLTGDSTLEQKWADDSLNPEESKKYKPIIALAKAQNISHKDAAEILSQRVEPRYTRLSGKRQNDITKSFADKNAGFYNTMTVYDENGEEWLATDLFEEEGLLDSDGNFVHDSLQTSKVKVDGIIGPTSGIAPKGLAVSVGSKNFIFVDRDPNPSQVEEYMKNQLDLINVAIVPEYARGYEYPPGTMIVRDQNQKATVIPPDQQ